MMAWTLPFSITRSRPLSIFLPSTSTCRFLTSSSGIVLPVGVVVIVAIVVIVARRRRAPSSHAALEADRDELLALDRKFHRQLLQHVLDETVDHQRHRFLGGEPALHAIEQRLLRDFRG